MTETKPPREARGAAGRLRFVNRSLATMGVLILKPETVRGSQANSAIQLGIIGCGGRGNLVEGYFTEHTGARIVALGRNREGRHLQPGRHLQRQGLHSEHRLRQVPEQRGRSRREQPGRASRAHRGLPRRIGDLGRNAEVGREYEVKLNI